MIQLKLFQDDTKICRKCKEVKAFSEFHKDKEAKDGLRYDCKDCCKKYREVNKDKIKQYYQENKEKIKQQKKQYRKGNKEKIIQQGKQYREENKEKIKQKHKQYYEKNKEKIIQRTIQRRKTDTIFRLTHNIRSLITISIKNKGYSKKTRTYKILGIEYEDFYTWLNTEASNGLSFDKDDVHVDHVIPVSFAYTEEEVLTLNHYSNLQLLTESDNFEKGNRYISKLNLDRVFNHHTNPELLKTILRNSDYVLK